jgi:hypothetical protein
VSGFEGGSQRLVVAEEGRVAQEVEGDAVDVARGGIAQALL